MSVTGTVTGVELIVVTVEVTGQVVVLDRRQSTASLFTSKLRESGSLVASIRGRSWRERRHTLQ